MANMCFRMVLSSGATPCTTHQLKVLLFSVLPFNRTCYKVIQWEPAKLTRKTCVVACHICTNMVHPTSINEASHVFSCESSYIFN